MRHVLLARFDHAHRRGGVSVHGLVKMRTERFAALRLVLTTCFPKAIMPEGARKVPLQFDIFAQIVGVMPEIDVELLRKFLLSYVQKPSYLEALAAPGAMRHDLEGWPVERVSAAHRAGALDKLAMFPARPSLDPAERRRIENAKRKARRRRRGEACGERLRAHLVQAETGPAVLLRPEAAE